MNKKILILFGILLLASALRLFQLGSLPPSLEWDEVATGYDAYSILKTGKDQFGNFLPVTMRSIDDYKPPLYTYLTVASIAMLGWSDFSVRFPAALMGILAVLTTYLMTRSLFKSDRLALLSALLLAISPWHVNFSRLALETNSTIFFTTAAVYFFIAGNKKGFFLPLSALFFGLDLYLYHNARVFVPLLGLFLLISYYKELLKKWRWTLISGVIIALFFIRLIPIATSVEGQMRFHATSIFSVNVPEEIEVAKKEYAQWRVIDNQSGLSVYGSLFHNQYVLFGLRLFRNYLTHYNPTFWLFTNDYPRHHVPEMGIVYFIELPFILIGLLLLRKYSAGRAFYLILFWFLIAPIPSAVTQDVPHALRSEILLPTLQIFAAAALIGLFSKMRENLMVNKVYVISLSLIYWVLVSFFLHKFLFHYSRVTSQDWQYGRKEAALYAESVKNEYSQIIVSPTLDQPHIFFLYYLRYDPKKYLAEGGTVSGGWAEERNHFDKYYFRRFDFQKEQNANTLFIGIPRDFPPDVTPVKKVFYLDGKDAIWIVK